MRICLISASYPPESTEGISRQRQVLAEALVALGHAVVVVTCSGGLPSRVEAGVQVLRVVPRRINRFLPTYPGLDVPLSISQALYEGLASLCKGEQFDIVDIPLWQAQGLVTLRHYRSTAVVWLQTTSAQLLAINGLVATPDQRALLALERICLTQADGLLGDSVAALATTLRDYQLAHPQVGVALLGLPLGLPLIERRARGTVDALVVGRLERRKGTPLLFEVLPELLHRYPQLRVRFVGHDNSANDGWHQQHNCDYPTFFRHSYPQFEQRVVFDGYVAEHQLAQAYQNADILLAPARYESFGLTYVEGMRASLPVVACASGGALEVFAGGIADGALLVPPDNGAALIAAVSQLIEQPALRWKLGMAGYARFVQHFSAQAMATATLDFYERVLHHRVRTSRNT